MMEETLNRIQRATADLPERWKTVLEEALLKGEFNGEADRLLKSAVSIHRNHSPKMETAESILAGDAFIPMAVSVLLESGVPLEEIERILTETTGTLS